jgi:DNA-binding NarL/FixJ family response regulator
MHVVILSPVLLLGNCLAASLRGNGDITVGAVVDRFSALRDALEKEPVDIALIDVSHNIALEEVRAIAIDWPDTALVALGLDEHRHEVTRCCRAGFVGYVARERDIGDLQCVLQDVAAGRMTCSAEVSAELMRALFQRAEPIEVRAANDSLTKREEEVLRLIGRGMSNKEIARELSLSVATVKQHVHHVLGKLHLTGRAQAMRRVRDEPWMGQMGRVTERS